MTILRSVVALLGLTVLTCVPGALAQGAPPGPLAPEPGVQPEKTPPGAPKPSIRVRVNGVIAPVTVVDRSGEMVFDLTQKDFRVFDDGAEQKIEHFDLGGDALSVVLAIEKSSRIEPLLPAVRKTGIVFSQTVVAPTAEAAVIGFDDEVDVLDKFTTDRDRVQDTIDHLRMGMSGARLYDAMARGVSLLDERATTRRRILVVLAEAQDTGSENKLGEVLRQAQLANVTIYSIGLSTAAAAFRSKPNPPPPTQIGPPGTFPVPTPNGMPQTPDIERQMQQNVDLLALAELLVKTGMNALGPNSLAVASKATGGLHLNIMKDRSIEEAIDEIGGELHAQYTLGYRPAGDQVSGYHEIKVQVHRPGVTVRTRPGYYLPPPNEDHTPLR
ncbi:MAG: VWA domain-containing protein [Candidatus Acidiferrales bacterium]